MKSISEYRKSCWVYVLIDLVLLLAGIVSQVAFHDKIQDWPLFGDPALVLPILSALLLLDLVVVRWLLHLAVEVSAPTSDRTLKRVKEVNQIQRTLHVVVLAALAGVILGKMQAHGYFQAHES